MPLSVYIGTIIAGLICFAVTWIANSNPPKPRPYAPRHAAWDDTPTTELPLIGGHP